MKRVSSLLLALLIIFTGLQVNGIQVNAINSFTLSAIGDNYANNGLGAVNLDWSSYSGNNVTFKGYASNDGGQTYQSISLMDYTSVKEIKVLQIYPTYEAATQLKSWMETNGYGKGIIKVTEVYWDDFNNNPSGYLYKNYDGKWNYDVILFGTWDSNGGKDLTNTSMNIVKQYIEDGKGSIFGHDTLVPTFPNMWALRNYFNILDYSSSLYPSSDKVYITKKGLLTSYPYNIGEIGTELTIPTAHSSYSHQANGDIWLRFPGFEETNQNFYLTTYNNCAMIQTGHSNGQATDDEQKILANLIFYCYQLTSATNVTDNAAMDTTNPNRPNLSFSYNNGKMFLSMNAIDNGTTWNHYIEAYSKDDMTNPIAKSNTTTTTIKSGIKGFRYIIDNNSSTILTKDNGNNGNNGNFTYESTIELNNNYKYAHVAAIDNAGNVSETIHYEIPQTIDLTTSMDWNDNNNKNGFRPSKYTLKLLRNGSVFKQVELISSQTSYTFDNLDKYDSNGKAYTYTFQVDANSDRYKMSIDGNGNIIENYQNSLFSVIIPKNISLNGNTGKGSYNVKVNGTFYYNDTLTVIPSNSFKMIDKSGISNINASVTQDTTTFTKSNLASTKGTITLNKAKFAGSYKGTFNFAIKFTMKN